MDFVINQERLDSLSLLNTYVDIVYCIDVTSSMKPCIDTVKRVSLNLHNDLKESLAAAGRTLSKLRIRVIAFRDAYCDGSKAFECSNFFDMDSESNKFTSYLNSLTAKGGGDIPESSLEALAMAINSPWCTTFDSSIRKRHIIILFTDASAHPLEQSKDGIDNNYPPNMPKTYSELIDMWGSAQQGTCLDEDAKMDPVAKRLAIFAPENSDPWSKISFDLDGAQFIPIEPDKGGSDISTDILLTTLSQTLA